MSLQHDTEENEITPEEYEQYLTDLRAGADCTWSDLDTVTDVEHHTGSSLSTTHGISYPPDNPVNEEEDLNISGLCEKYSYSFLSSGRRKKVGSL